MPNCVYAAWHLLLCLWILLLPHKSGYRIACKYLSIRDATFASFIQFAVVASSSLNRCTAVAPFTYRQLNLSALNCISISARFLYPVYCLPLIPSLPACLIAPPARLCECARLRVCVQIIRQQASLLLSAACELRAEIAVNWHPLRPRIILPPSRPSLSLSCLHKYASEYENNTVNNVK